jgi:hypothetical protein
MSGLKKFDDDYAKKNVACGTHGASVMLVKESFNADLLRQLFL